MFKDTLDKMIKEKNNKKTIVNHLMKEYKITLHEVHKRVNSYYGCNLDNLLIPSKEEFTRLVLVSNDINELKKLTGISTGLGAIYEKYYKVSTYAACKKEVERYREVVAYNPSRADNFSLLVSQYFGDGHFNKEKRAIDIQHGIAQLDYLILKAKLFNKAFPKSNPVGSLKTYKHAQGHLYCRWWSGKIESHMYDIVLSSSIAELFSKLTPLGMYLFYMDDGCLKKDTNQITISSGNVEVLESLCIFLSTYGITSHVYKDVVCMSSVSDVTKFLNCFVKPFNHLTPECMLYKTVL